MKQVGWLIFLAAGIGLGWYGRGWSDSRKPDRAPSDRTAAPPVTTAPGGGSGPGGTGPAAAGGPERRQPAQPADPPAASEETAEGGGAEAAPADGPDMDALAEMFRAQTPQWKAFAKMQVKQRLGPLLRELGYDPATATQIEEAFLLDADRSIDQLIAMMLGEGPVDDSMANWMIGVPAKLSPQLERDLATFLGDGELGRLRDQVKESHDKQMDDFVQMQINMMGIADLTEAQRQEVQGLLRGNDPMREQFRQFADVTRDRNKLARLMSGEGIAEEMEKSMAPRRERMRQILTPLQFEQYRRYEQTLVKQAEMGMKMFQAMAKQSPGTSQPSGK